MPRSKPSCLHSPKGGGSNVSTQHLEIRYITLDHLDCAVSQFHRPSLEQRILFFCLEKEIIFNLMYLIVACITVFVNHRIRTIGKFYKALWSKVLSFASYIFLREKGKLFLGTLANSKADFLVEKRSCLHNIYDKIRFHSSVAFFFFYPPSKIGFPYMEKGKKPWKKYIKTLTKLNNSTWIFLQEVHTKIIITKYAF